MHVSAHIQHITGTLILWLLKIWSCLRSEPRLCYKMGTGRLNFHIILFYSILRLTQLHMEYSWIWNILPWGIPCVYVCVQHSCVWNNLLWNIPCMCMYACNILVNGTIFYGTFHVCVCVFVCVSVCVYVQHSCVSNNLLRNILCVCVCATLLCVEGFCIEHFYVLFVHSRFKFRYEKHK